MEKIEEAGHEVISPENTIMSKVQFLADRSLKEERAFLELANEVSQTSFPNPERQGCPDPGVLQAIAQHQFDIQTKEVMFHVTKCSPCSAAFSQFCQEYRSPQRTHAYWFFRIAALIFVVMGLSFWFWVQRIQNPANLPGSALRKAPGSESLMAQKPVVAAPLSRETVTLDLTSQLVLRSGYERANSGRRVPLELPRKNISLALILPPGNDPGVYEVRIHNSQSQVNARGNARLVNQTTILEVQMDTSGLPAGTGQLGIRQPGWQWSDFPVNLK